MTAYLASASVANRLALKGSKEMEDTGPLTAIIWACHWLRWVFMDHTTYSPDITPSKFDSFRCLKKYLAGKRLAKNADVKQAVTSWPDS